MNTNMSLREAVTQSVDELENHYGMKWQVRGKGTKENIINAFSQRKMSAREFLGYAGSDGLRHVFGRGLKVLDKPKNMQWEIWILHRIGRVYCATCDTTHLIADVNKNYTCNDKLYKKTTREKTSAKLLEYLMAHPCELCGESDPVVLEFDHMFPENKQYNIGERSGRTWSTVYEEIKKCRVLCANCHKKHTAKVQAWHKYTN